MRDFLVPESYSGMLRELSDASVDSVAISDALLTNLPVRSTACQVIWYFSNTSHGSQDVGWAEFGHPPGMLREIIFSVGDSA